MKRARILFSFVFALYAISATGQLGINPQVGINFTRLSEEPVHDFEVEGKGGIYAGVDLRLGGRFYIQPGLFITGSKTVYKYNDSLFVNVTEVTRYGAKLKGMVGYKILDKNFKLRLTAGPSYNFELSLNEDDNPYFDENHFNNGTFNLDVAVGVDILFLTAEAGYSYGFTDVFERDVSEVFSDPPKYQTWYITLGIIIGN